MKIKLIFALLVFISLISIASAMTISPQELTFHKNGECKVVLITRNVTVYDVQLVIYGVNYESGNSADWFSLSTSRLAQVSQVHQEVAVCLDKPCCLGDEEYRATLMVKDFPVQLKIQPENSVLKYLWILIGVIILITIVKRI